MNPLHPKKSRISILEEFNAAPSDAWFGQETVAVIQNRSIASVQRDRWLGKGVPFIKCGRSVRYRKSIILASLAEPKNVTSTTQAQAIKQEENHG